MRLHRFTGRRPSIYEHISAHVTADGLSEEGQTLPDEEEIAAEPETELRWAPGALEGAFSRHANPEDDEAQAAEVHAALVELSDHPGGKSRARACSAFRRAEPRTHVDAVLARLQAYPPRNLDRLYAEVRTIAAESGRREEVKFALAVLCNLAGALEREYDRELITSARDILSTLADDAWGGPAGGMLDYSDGLRATERYLGLVEPRTLDDYLAIDSLRSFLADDLSWADGDERRELEAKLADLGWTDDAREALADRCRRILGSPLWRDLVQSELAQEHDELPWRAIQVARRIGLPVRDFLLNHLERNPADSGAWFNLVHQSDDETLDAALALAEKHYDFDDLAEGPAHELHRDGVFMVADWLLQELVEHPGKGWKIICPSLQSPVVRNRHFALRSLSRWPVELMTSEQHDAVAEVAASDPDADVREDAERVLRGERIDPPKIDLSEPEE
jgi:hypothetical protein